LQEVFLVVDEYFFQGRGNGAGLKTHITKACKQHHEAGPLVEYTRKKKERPSQE